MSPQVICLSSAVLSTLGKKVQALKAGSEFGGASPRWLVGLTTSYNTHASMANYSNRRIITNSRIYRYPNHTCLPCLVGSLMSQLVGLLGWGYAGHCWATHSFTAE